MDITMHSEYDLETALKLRTADTTDTLAFQKPLLLKHLRQAINAPYYSSLFQSLKLEPEDIQTPNDLDLLPFTRRDHLEQDPTAFQAVPPILFADLAMTSGTTGTSIPVPYTTNDLHRLAFNECMGFWGAGVRQEDSFLLSVTLDRCFIAGLAYYSGLIRLGATTIRSGPGQPSRQWEIIRQFKPNSIVGVPTFLLKLATWAQEHGINPAAHGIQRIVTIGEPIRRGDFSLTPLGTLLEEAWDAQLFSSYGATEIETAFCDCQAGAGGHIHPEFMIVEIIDEHGNRLPPGRPGEVVVTPLGVEGLPLLRFQTGDVARLHTGPCTCGWQTPRLGPIEGRLAQRLKFHGTTLYPETIFQALQEIPEIQAAYIEVRSSFDLADDIRVVVGSDIPLPESLIAEHLQARLRVRPKVTVKSKAEVQNTMELTGGHKPKKFFDLRHEKTI